MKVLLHILFLFILSLSGHTQKLFLPLDHENNKWSGQAWMKLTEALKSSRILLVGEVHGTAEIPSLIMSIQKEFEPDHFITELDSISLASLQDKMESGLVLKEQQEHVGYYAMYSTEPELHVLQEMIDDGVEIHGVDLLHPVSQRLVINEMIKRLGEHSAQKEKLQKCIEKQEKGFYSKGYFDRKTDRYCKKQVSKIKDFPEIKPIANFYFSKAYGGDWMRKRAAYMRDRINDIPGINSEKFLIKMGGSHTADVQNSAGYQDVGELMKSRFLRESLSINILAVSGEFKAFFNGPEHLRTKAIYQNGTQEMLNALSTRLPDSGNAHLIDTRTAQARELINSLELSEEASVAFYSHDLLLIFKIVQAAEM